MNSKILSIVVIVHLGATNNNSVHDKDESVWVCHSTAASISICMLVGCVFFFLIYSVRVVRAHNRHACLSHVSSIARVDVPMRLLLVYSQQKAFFLAASFYIYTNSIEFRGVFFLLFMTKWNSLIRAYASCVCVLCIKGFMRCMNVYKYV